MDFFPPHHRARSFLAQVPNKGPVTDPIAGNARDSFTSDLGKGSLIVSSIVDIGSLIVSSIPSSMSRGAGAHRAPDGRPHHRRQHARSRLSHLASRVLVPVQWTDFETRNG